MVIYPVPENKSLIPDNISSQHNHHLDHSRHQDPPVSYRINEQGIHLCDNKGS